MRKMDLVGFEKIFGGRFCEFEPQITTFYVKSTFLFA